MSQGRFLFVPETVPLKMFMFIVFFLVDVSDIFYFFCSGEGRGTGATERGGGSVFFIENPRRGGESPKWGGGREGRECLRGIWGSGGAKYFFSGRNVHQVFLAEDR